MAPATSKTSGAGASVYVIAVALLMVSRLPTFGPKAPFGQFPRAALFFAPGIVLIGIPALILEPWLLLSAVAGAYILVLPFGWYQYELKLRRTRD